MRYLKQRTSERQEQYKTLSKEVLHKRRALTPKHVIWGEGEYAFEVSRSAPTIAEGTLHKQEELPGAE